MHHPRHQQDCACPPGRSSRIMRSMDLYPLGLLLGLAATWALLALSDRVRAMLP